MKSEIDSLGILTVSAATATTFLQRKYPSDVIFPTQVGDYIRNERARQTLRMTDVELLKSFIEHAQPIYSTIDESGPTVKFTLTLSTPFLQGELRKYGSKVVGLDSVYKLTDLRIPIWVVVVSTGKGSLLCAVIVSTSGAGADLAPALAVLFPDDPKPVVMIDHDNAERLALVILKVPYC
jgi:hypothetical protein